MRAWGRQHLDKRRRAVFSVKMQIISKVNFLLFTLRKGREGGAPGSGLEHCSVHGPASVVLAHAHSAHRALLATQTKIVGELLMVRLSGQEVGRVLDKEGDNR